MHVSKCKTMQGALYKFLTGLSYGIAKSWWKERLLLYFTGTAKQPTNNADSVTRGLLCYAHAQNLSQFKWYKQVLLHALTANAF